MPIKKTPHVKRDAQQEAPRSKAQVKHDRRAKLTKGGKIVLVAIGCAAMLLSVTAMACSGILNQATEKYHLTGGVAATVNGMNITEDTITKQIMNQRTSGGYTDDKAWAQYLVDNGYTPESLRKQTIERYVQQLLISQAEKEYKIEVTDKDVQKAWDDTVARYDSEKDFLNNLSMFGYDEQSYKQSLAANLKQTKLKEKVSGVKDPSDEQIVEYLNNNLDTYNNARRSENLLIKVDSDASKDEDAKAKATAQEALDKINSGELSFEDAVEKYSEDTGSKKQKGDVGWDKLTSFVPEYQDALSKLNKDQVSGLVKTSYGYHIIKCTDVFSVQDKVSSIDEVPAEIKDYLFNMIKTNEENTGYSTWFADYKEKADIVIKDMPAEVPYNVNLKGVKPSSETGSNNGSAQK